MTAPRWRKSSHSGQEGDCVELAHTLDTVRDSKNPHGPTLTANIPALLKALKPAS
ncbi:DUF397 domain-containing protein [Actinokineospora sp.]|uniref:DUF397 domain-containing protein n=1 Tax=Actinokineospora sp. TaxID=1872133 RepID=UPI00403764AD